MVVAWKMMVSVEQMVEWQVAVVWSLTRPGVNKVKPKGWFKYSYGLFLICINELMLVTMASFFP